MLNYDGTDSWFPFCFQNALMFCLEQLSTSLEILVWMWMTNATSDMSLSSNMTLFRFKYCYCRFQYEVSNNYMTAHHTM